MGKKVLALVPALKVAVGYTRISTDKQNESSHQDQRKRITAWAVANGYTVGKWYEDTESAATLHRPGLAKLRREAKGGGWAALAVYNQDRLSRDSTDTGLLLRELKKLGVDVFDATSGASLGARGQKLNVLVNGYMAEEFLRVVGEKTYGAMESRAEAGHWTGGRCFGYSTVRVRPDDEKSPKVAVINKAEAAVVLRIFETYADGASLKDVVDLLNRDKVPAPYDAPGLGYQKKAAGHGWGSNTVGNVLKNEKYIGRVRWNVRAWAKDSDSGKRVARLRSESEHKISEHPELRIVPQLLWQKVQRMRAARTQRTGRPRQRNGANPSALSTLLRCGLCGGAMALAGTSAGHRSFACCTYRTKGKHGPCVNGASISEEKVLHFLGESVRQSLEAKNGAAAAFEAFIKTLEKPDAPKARPDVAALDAAVRKATTAARNVGESMRKHGYSETLSAMLVEAEAALREAKEARAAAEVTTPTGPPQRWGSGPREGWFALHLRAVWANMGGLFARVANRSGLELRAELLHWLDGPVTLTPRETKDGTVWTLATALNLAAELPADKGRKTVTPKASCGGGI